MNLGCSGNESGSGTARLYGIVTIVGTRSSSFSRILLILSILLFVASLFLDAFYTSQENPRSWSLGFGLLVCGWLGLFDGIVAWLANPLLLAAWILLLLRWPRGIWPLVFAVAALALALSFLRVDDLMVDEAGGRAMVTGYGPGYWVWMSSMLVACVAALLKPRFEPSSIPVAQIAPQPVQDPGR
jgi:hypothetical protein